MIRLVGFVLVAAGAVLVLPQLVTVLPDQRLVAFGLVIAVLGGLLIADHEPRSAAENRRTDGNRRG